MTIQTLAVVAAYMTFGVLTILVIRFKIAREKIALGWIIGCVLFFPAAWAFGIVIGITALLATEV